MPLPSPSLQAGLDKMSKGHMLADVVAIIGTSPPSGRDVPGRGARTEAAHFLFTGTLGVAAEPSRAQP